MLTLMGFGQTSLSGVRRGFMPPQLKTKIIMFKIIILCQIKADRYQKLIFKILLLSPLGELCTVIALTLFEAGVVDDIVNFNSF